MVFYKNSVESLVHIVVDYSSYPVDLHTHVTATYFKVSIVIKVKLVYTRFLYSPLPQEVWASI